MTQVELGLQGRSGFQFSRTFTFSLPAGVTLTNPEVVITSTFRSVPSTDLPTVTSTGSNQWQLLWSGAQTADLAKLAPIRYYLQAYLQADVQGATADLVAGSLAFPDPWVPGTATTGTVDLTTYAFGYAIGISVSN